MRCASVACMSLSQTDSRGAKETHHQVAIKVVRKDILTAKLLDNLQSEIEILKSLSHRHITKLIDIVVCGVRLVVGVCCGCALSRL